MAVAGETVNITLVCKGKGDCFLLDFGKTNVDSFVIRLEIFEVLFLSYKPFIG
jgi:hypothetical protein